MGAALFSMSDRKRRPMQWFKFDPTVVGTIVEDLDLSGQGAYFKLMRSLWVFGPLSEAEVRRKCGPTFGQLRELMCPVGECLSFAWLEALRSEGQHVSDVRAAAATVRHSKQKEASDLQLHANAMQLPSMSKSSSRSQGRVERASEKQELTWPAFAGEKVKAKWAEFIAYRIAEKKQRYRSIETEQKALNLVVKYFHSGQEFVSALEHTMAKTWVFPVDPIEYKYPPVEGVPVKTGWNPRA